MLHKLFRFLVLTLGILVSINSCDDNSQDEVDLPDKKIPLSERAGYVPTIFRVGDKWEIDGKERPAEQSLADALKATRKTTFKVHASDDMPAKYLDDLFFAVKDRKIIFQLEGGGRGYNKYEINVHNYRSKGKVDIEPMLIEVLGGKQKENVILNKTEKLSLLMLMERLFSYEETCAATGMEPLLAIHYRKNITYGDLDRVFRSYADWRKQDYTFSVTRYKELGKKLWSPVVTSDIKTKPVAPSKSPVYGALPKQPNLPPKYEGDTGEIAPIIPDEPDIPEIEWVR